MAKSSFGAGFGGAIGAGCGCLVFILIIWLVWFGGCIALISNLPKDKTLVQPGDSSEKNASESRQSDAQKNESIKTAVESEVKEHNKIIEKSEEAEKSNPKAEPENKETKIDRLNLINYYRIEHGMTYQQVKAILGPASEELSSSSFGAGTEFATKTVMLTWEGSWGKNAIITFQNGRVAMKSQFGLPDGDKTPDYVDPEILKKQEQEKEAKEIREKEHEAKKEADQKKREEDEMARWRTWNSADGKFTTKARYSGIIDGKVVLKKENGKNVQVDINLLSDEDREWLKNRQKKNERDLILFSSPGRIGASRNPFYLN
jgi:uncharacterized cupin superfamily protein